MIKHYCCLLYRPMSCPLPVSAGCARDNPATGMRRCRPAHQPLPPGRDRLSLDRGGAMPVGTPSRTLNGALAVESSVGKKRSHTQTKFVSPPRMAGTTNPLPARLAALRYAAWPGREGANPDRLLLVPFLQRPIIYIRGWMQCACYID
ncbi:hypothetical protein LY78DRAFT_215724 [Colletotrichum sublineola]|nr:hypothetical protein LY78DRAFT_215724 [Colletotrichum sublineola]